jgi:4-amino-4-deoxy-L-arabinose transferase-like glycosyltransferase
MLATLAAWTERLSARLLARLAPSQAGSMLLAALVALAAFLPGYASLPPTDRDEGRYVMATQQMLESGDFLEPRNQDLPRHKQPAGIYWLQAAAAALSGQGAEAPIGVFRLPSLAGAVASAALTVWAFRPLVGPQAALLAGLLFAPALLLGVEARIAKTDAALLAFTLPALGVLLRAFLDPAATRAGRLPWLFWASLGAAAMIKGPIGPLVVLLAAAALCLPARGLRWLGALRPWPGVLVMLALALPWYVAIAIATRGEFFATALGWNALGKVTEAHQGHGGPPGLYSLLVWVTFWPAAPFLAATLWWIWRERRLREVQALLCLILPAWVMFEAVATKLPHYVLPTYPALAALVALALGGVGAMAGGWFSALMRQGFWLLPAAMGGLGLGAFLWFEGWPPAWAPVAFLLAVGLGVLAGAVARRSAMAAAPVAAAAALATWLGAWPLLARAETIWLSPRMAEAAARHAPCAGTRLASAGYREPSLVVLTRTDTLLTDGEGAALFLAEGPCRLAFVDAAPGRRGRPAEEAAFLATLAARGLAAEPLAAVEGRNLNGGRHRRVVLWRLRGGA